MKFPVLLALALNSFQISSAQSMRPAMSSNIPITGVMSVGTYSGLSITFDRPVTKGIGNIYVRNRTLMGTTTIPVVSPNVTISGATVTVGGLILEAGSFHHITFDSAAFESAGYKSYGLYDTSTWWFRTAGTAVGIAFVEPSSNPVSLSGPASNGLFVLSCTLPNAAVIEATVHDLLGRVVSHHSFTGVAGENSLHVQTSAPAGTYLIEVDHGKMRTIVKANMQ